MKARFAMPALLVAVLIAGCGSSSSSSSSSGTGQSTGSSGAPTLGFEGIPIEQGSEIAPASTTQTGTVDGISCGPTERLEYHIHAYLAVYLDGAPRSLPAGIGIPGSVPQQTGQGPIAVGGECIYWLHTHTSDGVIHIESPAQRIYSLGEFFDLWHQPLTPGRVGGLDGKVTAIVDGKQWSKSPRAIPLLPHAVIQLDVGSASVPFKSVSWNATGL